MFHPRGILLLAIIYGMAQLVLGDSASRSIEPLDLWKMKRLGSPELSPDGQRVVYTVQIWNVVKNKSTSHLYLTTLATGETRPLTTTQSVDCSPVWSPDGKTIAFLSKRGDNEATALYLIPWDGGEATEALSLPYPIYHPQWLPDSKSLIFGTRVIPELAGTLGKADRGCH